MSTFGGPDDTGVGPDEGLALVDSHNLDLFKDLLLPAQPPGTTGLARRLDPDKFYLACRWNYQETPKAVLAKASVQVKNPLTGKSALARPVDYGPAVWTGRVADLSPGLARDLGLVTNDEVEIRFSPGAPIIIIKPAQPPVTGVKLSGVFNNNELRKYFGTFTYDEDYSRPGAWIIIDPPWEADNITNVFIPSLKGVPTYGGKLGGQVRCHKKIATDLAAAFDAIYQAGLSDRILFWAGSHAARHKGHDRSRDLSPHSWGIALDINDDWNPYGGKPAPKGAKGSVVELVDIFEKYGFYWGGNFSAPYTDGMHFEYARIPQ
jgi:hypothetical protein